MAPLNRGRSRCCNYGVLAIVPLKRGRSRRCNYGALAISFNMTLYTHLLEKRDTSSVETQRYMYISFSKALQTLLYNVI